jgi:hypothetical protein
MQQTPGPAISADRADVAGTEAIVASALSLSLGCVGAAATVVVMSRRGERAVAPGAMLVRSV